MPIIALVLSQQSILTEELMNLLYQSFRNEISYKDSINFI